MRDVRTWGEIQRAGLTLAFVAAALLPQASAAQGTAPVTLQTPGGATATPLPDAPQPVQLNDSVSSSSNHELEDTTTLAAEPDLLAFAQQIKPRPQPTQQPSDQAPSLGDLGLPSNETKADPDLQARLDRRSHMLKVHQRLGLITLAPLVAACITSALAPPDPRDGHGNTVGRDLHVSLGATSVTLYGFTAYYAIRAPRVSNEPARGGIKLHKYLIYIHAPGMILTPILGAMAFNEANDGERVHGIASAHAAVAWTTVASYSAAIVAVSWPIHLKF